jgi:cAMP-specific phosphodiesterase 4/high affinity cAMP-specific and IBMX-insensitive 3',5'-cyclic phosphodiesterase 8
LQLNILLEKVDEWQYDMFALEEVTQSHALSVLGFALLKRTETYQKFKMDEFKLAR